MLPLKLITLSLFLCLTSEINSKEITTKSPNIINAQNDKTIKINNRFFKSPLKSIGTNRDSTLLPTPSALFLNTIDSFAGIDFIMEKYITLNFNITSPLKIIKYTTSSHPDGVYPCLTRTEYGRIATETLTCGSYSITKIIEFTDYGIEEVKKLMIILLATQAFYCKEDYWSNDEFIYGDEMCSLDMLQVKNKIIVSYGCSC